jgi:hypothetical protein
LNAKSYKHHRAFNNGAAPMANQHQKYSNNKISIGERQILHLKNRGVRPGSAFWKLYDPIKISVFGNLQTMRLPIEKIRARPLDAISAQGWRENAAEF